MAIGLNDVGSWVQAGAALAGLVAGGVGYLIRRSVMLERRMNAIEHVAADALQEVTWLREEMRDRRGGRRWYETGERAPWRLPPPEQPGGT